MGFDGTGVRDDAPCVLLKTISDSIVHDNVSTISGIIIDFDGPGVEDTMLADDFP